jgi:hypothetical protein
VSECFGSWTQESLGELPCCDAISYSEPSASLYKEPPPNLPNWSSLKLTRSQKFASSNQQKLLDDFDS